MPELPEVETVRRGLQPHVEGARIERLSQRRANLRFAFPDRFAAQVEGRTIQSLERRAKYLLWHLSGGDSLISHLGMSGSFRIAMPEGDATPGAFHHPRGTPGLHDHLVLHLAGPDGPLDIIYNDPRRFGFVLMAPTADLPQHKLMADIGMEPLGNTFDAAALARLFARKATPLKSALLDQKNICGIGNIYACEALWQARLSPDRQAGSLVRQDGTAGKDAVALAGAIRDVLSRAIAAGGSTLRDHRQADGALGYFQHSFNVYGREGAPCPRHACNGVILRTVQAGRSTFHCAACQG
jgi:formamidopyrimidine-DNA glycosylase